MSDEFPSAGLTDAEMDRYGELAGRLDTGLTDVEMDEYGSLASRMASLAAPPAPPPRAGTMDTDFTDLIRRQGTTLAGGATVPAPSSIPPEKRAPPPLSLSRLEGLKSPPPIPSRYGGGGGIPPSASGRNLERELLDDTPENAWWWNIALGIPHETTKGAAATPTGEQGMRAFDPADLPFIDRLEFLAKRRGGDILTAMEYPFAEMGEYTEKLPRHDPGDPSDRTPTEYVGDLARGAMEATGAPLELVGDFAGGVTRTLGADEDVQNLVKRATMMALGLAGPKAIAKTPLGAALRGVPDGPAPRPQAFGFRPGIDGPTPADAALTAMREGATAPTVTGPKAFRPGIDGSTPADAALTAIREGATAPTVTGPKAFRPVRANETVPGESVATVFTVNRAPARVLSPNDPTRFVGREPLVKVPERPIVLPDKKIIDPAAEAMVKPAPAAPAIPDSIRTVAEPRIGFRNDVPPPTQTASSAPAQRFGESVLRQNEPTLKQPKDVTEKFGVSPEYRAEIGTEGGATTSGPPGATPPDFPSAPRPSPEPPGSPRARIRERIVFESDKPKPTFRDRVTSRLHQLADYFDKTAPVARAERKATGSVSETGPTRTMEASQNRSAYDVESLWKRGTYRRFDADGNPIGEPIKFETPPSEIVKRVAEKGDMEDLSVYAVARRRQSRYTPSDIEAGFSPEDAAAFIDEIDRTKPHVKEAAEAISATYNVLWDALHDSGAISTKRWRASAGEFYVPMDRYFGPNKPAPGAVRGRNALSSPEIKGVKGGKQPIEDPVPKTFDRLRRMQEIVNRSRSGRKLIELRDAYPEAFDDIMREVGKGTKADFDFDTIIERQAERLRADGVPEPEIRDAARDLAIDEWADKFTGEHVVTHLPNGTKRVMQVLDEPMVNALSAGGSGLAKALNRIVESKAGRLLFQTVTKLKRLGITLDPAFSARQAIAADTTNAVMYDPGPMWRTPDRMLRGIFDASVSAINEWSRTVLNKGDLLPQTKAGRLYDESGAMHFAQGDRPVTAETAARPKTLFGKVARGAKKVGSGAANTLRLIQDAQQASMRRVAQYSLLSEWKKAGTWDGNVNSLTLDQMTQLNNAALRLGGSFRLGSNTSSAINKTIAFWKASERPFMDVFYWARKNKAKFARRSAVIAAPFIAEWMAYKDEDWYNDLPLWRRAGLNINEDVWFPIYNPAQVIGVAFREALRSAHEEGNTDGALVTAEAFSRSMPAIFQTFTDAATEYAENRETTRAVLKGIGGVTPDAAKGALEFATGVNTFTGRDINPMGSETLRKEAPEKVIDARIAPWVSDASRWLADLGVNITPNEIDHLTRAYGGTLGGTLTRRGSLLNRTFAPEGAPIPEPADDPLLGWVHRRIRESKEVSDFWNLYREFQGRRAATRVYERDQDADRLAEVGIDSIKELRPLLDQMRANNEQMAQAPVEEKRRLAEETREIARIGSYILREVMGLNEKPAPAFR